MIHEQIRHALVMGASALQHLLSHQHGCKTCQQAHQKVFSAIKLAKFAADEEADLIKMAREFNPDYPYDPKHELPLREAVWALCTTLEGTEKACDDLHQEIKNRDEKISAITKLLEENKQRTPQ